MEHIYTLLDKLLSLTTDKKNSIREKVFMHFLKKMRELPPSKMEAFYSSLQKSEDISLDIANMKPYFAWVPLDPEIKNKYKKNDDFSMAFRNLGNSAFQQKCFMEALRSYNMAVVFATTLGPELALAYANRSAALHGLGLMDEALKDIDLALSMSGAKDSAMQTKWIGRKNRIEEQIKARLMNPSFEDKLKGEISRRNAFYEEMFTIKAPNPVAPELEESVDIKWTPTRGRHIVANRDIPIGTTVLVEQPFVSTLANLQVWDVDNCHHCLKKNFRCIPCPNCVFTLYCDEACQADAQTYHQSQCPCLPELHTIVNDEQAEFLHFKLAFKLICFMGPEKLYAIFTQRRLKNKRSRVNEKVNNIAGCDPDTGIYSSKSYNALFNLMSSKATNDDYSYSILLSLMLSHTLMDNSNFFEFLSTRNEKIEFQDFIAELMLHHFNAFTMNAFGIGGINYMNGISLRTHMMSELLLNQKPKVLPDYDTESVAVGAFVTASLLNHSCDENVMRIFGKKFGTMAVVAVKSLKKGQELLISYGSFYGSGEEGEKRQISLSEIYKFQCDCIACTYNWPGALDLNSRQPEFCCNFCCTKFPHESKMSQEFAKCRLSRSDNFQCKSCKYQFSEISIVKDYDRQCRNLIACQKLIFSNYPLDAMPSLKSALEFFETTVCPPNYKCLTGAYLFNKAVLLTIFFSESDM